MVQIHHEDELRYDIEGRTVVSQHGHTAPASEFMQQIYVEFVRQHLASRDKLVLIATLRPAPLHDGTQPPDEATVHLCWVEGSHQPGFSMDNEIVCEMAESKQQRWIRGFIEHTESLAVMRPSP
jgi:hypothetical protein